MSHLPGMMMTAPATQPGTLHTGPSTLTPPKTAPKLSFLTELASAAKATLGAPQTPGQQALTSPFNSGVQMLMTWACSCLPVRLRKVLMVTRAPEHSHQCGVQETPQHPGGVIKRRGSYVASMLCGQGSSSHIALWDHSGLVEPRFPTGAHWVCTGVHVLLRVESPLHPRILVPPLQRGDT